MVMHTLNMPRLGETMDEGRIVRWLKAPGETFERGETILEIETDKTVAEYPALWSGRIVDLVRQEDELVSVGETIAHLEVSGPLEEPASGCASPPATEPGPQETEARTDRPLQKSSETKRSFRPRATPLARRLARQNGLDIALISGTGRRSRIEKSDVLAVIERGGNAPADLAYDKDVSFADLANGRIAYVANGPEDGPVTLLLHGFAADHSVWASVASGLARSGTRTISPDLPGHGLTSLAAENVSDLGVALPAFLECVACGLKLDIIAHSLGAIAAVALAQALPTHIRRLTLIAPAGLGPEIDRNFIFGMAEATSCAEVAHLLRKLTMRGLDLSSEAIAKIAMQMSERRLVDLAHNAVGPMGQRMDIVTSLAVLSKEIPVRVVFGVQDKIIPWQQITALPPTVAIHLMAASGHMPQWDQARDVLDIITSRWMQRAQ